MGIVIENVIQIFIRMTNWLTAKIAAIELFEVPFYYAYLYVDKNHKI
jgi:hypothetical protein